MVFKYDRTESYFNHTDYNLPTSLQEALFVDHHWRNILLRNSLGSGYDQLFRKSIYIDLNDPFIIAIFTTKNGGRHKIWVLSSQ